MPISALTSFCHHSLFLLFSQRPAVEIMSFVLACFERNPPIVHITFALWSLSMCIWYPRLPPCHWPGSVLPFESHAHFENVADTCDSFTKPQRRTCGIVSRILVVHCSCSFSHKCVSMASGRVLIAHAPLPGE